MITGLVECKRKIENGAVGEIVDYVRLLYGHQDCDNFFPAMLTDDFGFWLVLFKAGKATYVHQYLWETPGSVAAVRDFFSRAEHKSKWQLALENLCDQLGVIPLDGNAYLGRGARGRVFKVTRSTNVFALKVVLTNSETERQNVKCEYTKLCDCNRICNGLFVRAVPDNFAIVDNNNVSARGYLLAEVGEPVDKSNPDHQKSVLRALQNLHKLDQYHGDARVPNIVHMSDGRFLWIDPSPIARVDISACKLYDLKLLLKSLYGEDRAREIAQGLEDSLPEIEYDSLGP